MRRTVRFLAFAAAMSIGAVPALAVPTEITVRVLSKDAKFIGTSMGGVRITIRDADSGEVLAQGVTRGSTGDTQRIMREPWKRRGPLSTEGSASYTAVLDLDEPRRIEVSAWGPLAQIQSANKASATQWVVPGKHVNRGDAFLLLMPGLSVDVLTPPAHSRLEGKSHEVLVRANVTML